MTKRKGASRPRLKVHWVEAEETALIWNPRDGFRLTVPKRGRYYSMTAEEAFLNIMMMKVMEPCYVDKIATEFFDGIRKH